MPHMCLLFVHLGTCLFIWVQRKEGTQPWVGQPEKQMQQQQQLPTSELNGKCGFPSSSLYLTPFKEI